jgi:hypothetical protein
MSEIPKTADGLLRYLMVDFQRMWDQSMNFRPNTLTDEERRFCTSRVVELYGQIYLLGAVRHFAPDDADRVAAELATAWEAGDSLGEWVYQWRQELDAGDPLTIPLAGGSDA